MAAYTQAQLDSAIKITNAEYNKMTETTEASFVGQTRCNAHGQYKMYWEIESKLYYTLNTIRECY